MKKNMSILLTFVLGLSLAACGQAANEGEETNASAADGNVLVAYFSWSGNTEAAEAEATVPHWKCPCLRSRRIWKQSLL